MYFAHLVMHRDGDRLVVTDEPLLRVVVVEVLTWIDQHLNHFFSGGASWPYEVGIGPWDTYDRQPYNLGNQLFVFGQWWARKLLDTRRFEVLELPLTEEQSLKVGGRYWDDEDD